MTTKTFKMIKKGRNVIVVDNAGKEHGVFGTPFHAKMHIAKLLKERAPAPAQETTERHTHGS